LSGQPATDCYQSSSGLTDGLKLGLAGGAGVGLGMYYFGGDKVNPISNGVFHDDVLKAVEKDYKEVAKANAKNQIIIGDRKFASIEEYEATKKYVLASDAERRNFSAEELTKVKDEAKTYTETWKNEVLNKEHEINNIEKTTQYKDALAEAQKNHLGYQSEHLANLQKQKSLISGLAKDADKVKYEELIKSNPKAFGIEATEAATIEAEAKRIASGFTTKEKALTDINGKITNQLTKVDATRTAVNSKYASYWDDVAKELKPTASPELTKAVKNFKFTKAGKAGLIAAGVGLVLGWMFGGKS
jgi:hypothetical protein